MDIPTPEDSARREAALDAWLARATRASAALIRQTGAADTALDLEALTKLVALAWAEGHIAGTREAWDEAYAAINRTLTS